ncbi:folliculin-interacting protein N-terminus-domain-containing protein [Lophiotrema nucula]|uniref:Folliculin-interacting protein N-terminus-domain-containing protein n=1 Tax=Lophiotrema nucula TaxID=690887 RepID=A0A6A5ZSA0_9PLEO|nr:folliculin-interacting protein N-terminus-domain-containing protein [Lophiotrema nucula]
MLGQFFSSRKGAGSQHQSPITTLDSATEESHTRHLLYPDSNTLYHPEGQPYPLPGVSLTPGSGYDGPLPEIDLEYPRDCRIIIAQDASLSMPRTILYDSKPGPPRVESPTQANARSRALAGSGTASTAGSTFGGLHSRRSSLVSESSAPRSPVVGSFTRARARGGSISSMPNIDEHAQGEAKARERAQESIDVANLCLDCMFGNTPMNYRGNSNKIHIVPLDSRISDTNLPTPGFHDSTGSLGRAEGLRRRSHLAKSYTPSNLPPELPHTASGSSDTLLRESRRRTIFITRLFSVTLPEDHEDTSKDRTPTPQSSLGKTNGFPFPGTGAKAGGPKPPNPPQARKTPMYAITVILQLPVSSISPTMRPPSRPGHANQRNASHLSTSAPGHDSLGSSFDSERRAGWTTLDSNFGVDSFMSASLNSDVDDRVDVIGQHWDVITRTLTSLQFVVQERIVAHFKMGDATSPAILQPPRGPSSRPAGREASFQPPRRILRLQPNALVLDDEIRKAIEIAGHRIVSGMRIPRVMTGQGKWGVWREEARWLGRWAGRKEENFFFFNLLTAFLGNHTEWLNQLGPRWHIKRHKEHQKSTVGENLTIPNRTVIVSPDKMAARRLIFLLAAFLPTNASTLYDGASPMRPSTSASLRAYSQSPPSNMPPSRKHSLRRQINRRPRGKQSLTNMRPQAPTTNGASLAALESTNERSEALAGELRELPRHSRRSSAHSIHTSLVIPSMSDSVATTKSSAATTSTVTPQNAVPIAHFTLPRTKSSGPALEYRPESSDSLASVNLINTLQRSSTGHTSNLSTDSGNTSRWGSLMSFWSGGRRESSTDHSDYLQTTDDGLGIAGVGYRPPERPRSQLEQMVQELSMEEETFGDDGAYESSLKDLPSTADNSPETYPLGSSSGMPSSAARPIPERPKYFDATLKLSVNEKDGVIDVDVPLPDFGSPLQSPLLGGYASASSHHGSSFGESSVLSMPYCEPDQPVNAAGWLKQFHPDFAVQAIKPYQDLEHDIRRAMSAEPTPITSAITPTLEQGPLERWVEVCSALVADTRSFSIKRIRLRRLVKLIPIPTYQQVALTPGISGIPGRSHYGNPYSAAANVLAMTELHLDEKFIEEPIMDFDAILIDAVDRVLTQSGQGSRAQSTSSSRSSSRRGRRDTRSGSDVGHHADVTQTECRVIIFDALESVVKNVTAERGVKDNTKGEVNNDKEPSQENLVKTATDSSLKEGIRRWLSEVES